MVLLVCFKWLSFCLTVQNSQASRPVPEVAKQAQIMFLPPLCFTDGIKHLCQNAWFSFHQSILYIQTKMFCSGLIHPQNIHPIVFWLIHMVFGKVQTGSNDLFGEYWLCPCNSAMHTIVPYFPDGGLMNNDTYQCKRCLQILRLPWGSLRPPLLLIQSLLVIHSRENSNSAELPSLSDNGLVESKHFENSFVNLSSWVSINICFWRFSEIFFDGAMTDFLCCEDQTQIVNTHHLCFLNKIDL